MLFERRQAATCEIETIPRGSRPHTWDGALSQTATKSSDADSTAARYVRETVARPSKSMLSGILEVCTIFLKLQVSKSCTVLVVLVGGNLH
jgi:hypothetical protein